LEVITSELQAAKAFQDNINSGDLNARLIKKQKNQISKANKLFA